MWRRAKKQSAKKTKSDSSLHPPRTVSFTCPVCSGAYLPPKFGKDWWNALTIENRGKTKGERKESRKSWHVKGRSRSKSKAILECWHCGNKGHLKKDYWLRKKKKAEGHQENSQETNVVCVVVQDALILSLDNINDALVVDWSSSFHATFIGIIMSKAILDMYTWVMMKQVRLLERKGSNKVTKWKPMVAGMFPI